VGQLTEQEEVKHKRIHNILQTNVTEHWVTLQEDVWQDGSTLCKAEENSELTNKNI